MKLFNQVLPDTAQAQGINTVALPFDLRQRSRLRISIETGPLAGQAAGIELARGTVMRSGFFLATEQGDSLRVDAAAEALVQVQADSPQALTAIAYHLGNRHVPVQVGPDWLRLQQDHVLEAMVQGLDGRATHIDAAFEPESGAYHGGGGHHHHHDHDDPATPPDRRHSPRIHDLADPETSST